MFKKTLDLLPEAAPNQPYYNMFRRGAKLWQRSEVQQPRCGRC